MIKMPSRAKIKYKLIDYQAFNFTTINHSGEEKLCKFMEIYQMFYNFRNKRDWDPNYMWHCDNMTYLTKFDYWFICSYGKKDGLSVVNDATSLN